jgi:hypothetical protein
MEGVPPRPARGAPPSLSAAWWPPAGSGPAVRSGGKPGVKDSAFTGAAPSRHGGNRARQGRAGTARRAVRAVRDGGTAGERGPPPARGRRCAAHHPGRAARPPRRVQPGCLRAAAPAPRGRGHAAGNRPRRLTPAAFPHRPTGARGPRNAGRLRRGVRPREGTARRAAVARTAARQAPRRRGNLPGRARRPRAGRLAASAPLARSAPGAGDGQQNQQTV